jgi:prephenate dehydrogenase
MRVAIVGFGLIGGSIAKALHDGGSGDWSVVGWSPSGNGPRSALAAGVVEQAAGGLDDAVHGADLIVLAAPPIACLDLLDRLGPVDLSLASHAVVTDVASTKRRLVERAQARGVRFVGGHPMAGVESSGYEAADRALFVGRPWVVCPAADEEANQRVERLARAVGARPVRMDPATHDAAVAAISHLPLVVSAALVESVFGSDGRSTVTDAARTLAASGWRDATRLARGDVAMAAGIIATNADQIAARVRSLRDVLDGWLAELERADGPDHARLTQRLASSRNELLQSRAAAEETPSE